MNRLSEVAAQAKSPAIRIALIVSELLIVAGCTSFKNLEYAPFVRDLDGLSELEISTYPADYPKRLSEKEALFKRYESARELYFQVHIRDKKQKMGPNPNVRSISIDEFSYQIGNDPPKLLLTDYRNNLWMQNNPRYEKRKLPPIHYTPDGKISIKIRLSLNGSEFIFEGEMPAQERSHVLPTVIAKQGV